MKKIIVAILAMFSMIAGTMALTAPSAHADTTGSCENWPRTGLRVCVAYQFNKQADGSGYRITRVSVEASNVAGTQKAEARIRLYGASSTPKWSNGVTTLNRTNGWSKGWDTSVKVPEAGWWNHGILQFVTGEVTQGWGDLGEFR